MSTTGKASILVVDDTPANLSLMANLLAERYTVKLANSGARALELAAATTPDMILLDIMMPGMDGYEVCRRLKADPRSERIPVIFLTAQISMEDEEKGLSMGAVDFIHKPISPPIVLARIQTQLQVKAWQDFLQDRNAWLTAEVERRLAEANAARAERDQYLAQKLKIEGELSAAREIQMSLVPGMALHGPDWPHCQLYASLRSAKEVGGDLYDFFLDGEGKLVLAIGDVSGKGVPAALFMAVTKTLLKALSEVGQQPHELLERVNRELAAENDALMFTTLFCAKLDFTTGELLYSNAGHNPPLLVRQERVDWLKLPKGFVLGPDGASRYLTERLVLEPGDSLLASTDGVTEAMNVQRKLYGEPKLIELVRGAARSSPMDFVRLVEASVTEHAGEEPQSDDITLLAIRYLG
jgi:sigma-B regulation protein RsbU (phosphoserine phosphatase)